MEINSIKIPLPQVMIAIIIVGGWMYTLGGTTKSFEKEDEKVQSLKKELVELKGYMETVIQYLNGEDDGVRGDFENADKAIEKYEDLRSEKDKLEIKVWYYENIKQ